MLLAKLHLAQLLLFVAIVAANDAECLIYCVEDGSHRLIVGDALRVVALHDALQCVWSLDRLLLHDLVVLDDTQTDVRGYNGEAVDFLVCEILVGNLDDALLANLLGRQVVADGDKFDKKLSSMVVDITCPLLVLSSVMGDEYLYLLL